MVATKKWLKNELKDKKYDDIVKQFFPIKRVTRSGNGDCNKYYNCSWLQHVFIVNPLTSQLEYRSQNLQQLTGLRKLESIEQRPGQNLHDTGAGVPGWQGSDSGYISSGLSCPLLSGKKRKRKSHLLIS